MISYAQNHEDVLLERCFRDEEQGFYIDVGAWDPIRDSVTQHFYTRGWHGINVEPVSEFFERLQALRPRDVNIQGVLGATTGPRILNFIEGSGLSTTRDLDSSFVDDLSQVGYVSRVVEVDGRTLADVCTRYVPDGQEIDFLKVDVEGAEAEVLSGADWTVYRPKVLVIEAMRPVVLTAGTERPESDDASGEWEPEILAGGYRFATTDGLNRYYVREESSPLLEHFRLPVNVLDLYVPYSTWLTEQELATMRDEVSSAREALTAAGRTALELERRVLAADEVIRALRSSRSWKLTAPMRALADLLRRSLYGPQARSGDSEW